MCARTHAPAHARLPVSVRTESRRLALTETVTDRDRDRAEPRLAPLGAPNTEPDRDRASHRATGALRIARSEPVWGRLSPKRYEGCLQGGIAPKTAPVASDRVWGVSGCLQTPVLLGAPNRLLV